MTRRMIFPLLLGLIGAAILIGLGTWQVQRLQWKTAILADIDARIAADPVALPVQPDPEADRYLPVTVNGGFAPEVAEVLSSRKEIGPGVRVVQAFVTDDGRRILVDRGFVRDAERGLPRVVTAAKVTGNLHWPNETDSFTPPPDTKAQLWFARDVVAMAAALHTEPVLIIARAATGDGIEPMPVDSSAITNDHLNYAITWFLLALVWLGMTGYLLWRIRQRTI